MILDTNALSAWADGHPGIEQPLRAAQRLIVPTVVLGEYLFGISQSRDQARFENWLRTNLSHVEIAVIASQTARHYAAIRLNLKQNGTPIPTNDTWLAALARQHQLPILSNDRHFDRVPGITRVGW